MYYDKWVYIILFVHETNLRRNRSSGSMRSLVFIYDTCAVFEVSLPCMFLHDKGELVTAGLEMRDHESFEGLRLRPHVLLKDADMADFDCLVIPGGHPQGILGDPVLSAKVAEMDAKGGVVAAICGGPVHLARAGILKGKHYTTTLHDDMPDEFCDGKYVDELVVVDGNLITAKPHGNVDMAFAIMDNLRAWDSPEERAVTWRQYHQFLLE
jgi:putative intracellular protease/amidase